MLMKYNTSFQMDDVTFVSYDLIYVHKYIFFLCVRVTYECFKAVMHDACGGVISGLSKHCYIFPWDSACGIYFIVVFKLRHLFK